MNFLVIGGAGYIGSHFVVEAIRQGHRCLVYDNLERGHRAAVHCDASIVVGDIHDEKELSRTIKDFSPDVILHYAAYALVPESVANPSLYYYNNVGGVISLVKAMRASSYKKAVVFSSSCAVYGTPEVLPVTTRLNKNPESPYGFSKLFAEQILEDSAAADGFSIMSLRYFNACGADATASIGEDHTPETHLIPNLIKAALNGEQVSIFGKDFETKDGTCIRDYIHVTDLAQSHILAAKFLLSARSKAKGSYCLNIGSGSGYSNLEMLKMVEEVLGINLKYQICPRRDGDATALYADINEAKELIGFEPVHSSLKNIVETAYRWHMSHPHGYGRQKS